MSTAFSPRLWFGILLSFVAASMLNVYPLSAAMAIIRPMILMMVLIFWLIFKPQQVGLFIAFIVGLAADLLLDTRLGQHAFSAVLMALVVRISSIYIKRLHSTNAWVLACLCLFVFQLSMWVLQFMTQNMFIEQSIIPMLMSMVCFPILMWFLGLFIRK